jgi:CRP-like cAMP-binding protein
MKNELTVADGSGWRQVTSLAPAQEYPPGIELFKQESVPRDVYLIEEGMIKLLYVEQNGREVIVGLRSPGWLVGAAYVVLHKNYAFSATTMTKCRLRRITADAFLSLLKTDPEFAWYFHQVQSYELYDQLTQLVGFGCLSARDKLEQLFSRLVSVIAPHSDEQGVRLKLPLKHWELARLIGVTPEHLSRVLKEMQADGVIVRERGWVGIADVKKLR